MKVAIFPNIDYYIKKVDGKYKHMVECYAYVRLVDVFFKQKFVREEYVTDILSINRDRLINKLILDIYTSSLFTNTTSTPRLWDINGVPVYEAVDAKEAIEVLTTFRDIHINEKTKRTIPTDTINIAYFTLIDLHRVCNIEGYDGDWMAIEETDDGYIMVDFSNKKIVRAVRKKGVQHNITTVGGSYLYFENKEYREIFFDLTQSI